jgi:ADP-heptose:LPS heptosyltransferase
MNYDNQNKKILMVHLVANGDCLMATSIARQIKIDYPDYKLHWAISFKCKHIIEENPYIDEIIEVKYSEKDNPFKNVWYDFLKEAQHKNYYKIFRTQIYPENEFCYDGTTRSSTFNTYPGKITIPPIPILKLREIEKINAKDFSDKNNLLNYKHRILFECSPGSGQSFMNLELAIELSKQITNSFKDAIVILSTHFKIDSPGDRIVVANEVSLRENAALSHYCTFLIGCSSGISWLLTTEEAKKLNTVQILTKSAYGFRFASMVYDFEYWKLNTDHILETDQDNLEQLRIIISESLIDFKSSRDKFHQKLIPGHEYAIFLAFKAYTKMDDINFRRVLVNFLKRNNSRLKFILRFIFRFFNFQMNYLVQK